MPEPIFKLPEEIIRTIFKFCIDKRENWNRVNEQFLKGFFIRDIVKVIPTGLHQRKRWLKKWLNEHYIIDKKCSQWECLRPSMNIKAIGWNNNLPIITEWDLKTAQATCGVYINGELQKTISSGSNPVTEWLKNIKEFERNFPSYKEY